MNVNAQMLQKKKKSDVTLQLETKTTLDCPFLHIFSARLPSPSLYVHSPYIIHKTSYGQQRIQQLSFRIQSRQTIPTKMKFILVLVFVGLVAVNAMPQGVGIVNPAAASRKLFV